MKASRLTVVQKITAGYLLIAFFSLVALIYALTSMHLQTLRSEELVNRDFRALNLARDLKTNLQAQERLEKQYLLLRDPALLELLHDWCKEFGQLRMSLGEISLTGVAVPLQADLTTYHEKQTECCRLLEEKDWKQANRFSSNILTPLRSSLIGRLDELATAQGRVIDSTLQQFPEESDKAFRVTLFLAFIGFALSAPVAVTVIVGIHRSVRELVQATKKIAAGTFNYNIRIDRQDEFGHLAREFSEMGKKLVDLEQLRLDANPLTHLPGNLAIDRELESRIRRGEPFAHLYIDMDNFKAFGDRYGYRAGSEVIAWLGDLIRSVVKVRGDLGDMVGHIGGDDYVVLTAPERSETLAGALIEEFDRGIPQFYSPEDQQAGFFLAKDRFGIEREFPLLTVSIAIVRSENLDSPSPFAISRECAKMKEHLKRLPGSNYLIDRRKFS